ncbi:hypothetical protein L6452_04809 [Arctium lappa]|uniref:Uncharacterized protein n=1 Tax=Arctium lappa TaxID=4217 RepID=A0ACB9EEJ8_ARCLA|nr:hypothetical protein L6452_04809 [Arctium lappa]
MKGKRSFCGRRLYRIPSEDEVVAVEALLTLRNVVSFPAKQQPRTTVHDGGPTSKPEVNSPSTPLALTSISTADDLSDHSQKKQSFDPNDQQHAGMDNVVKLNEDEEI